MLRCADALHVSSSRAPLFLHALTRRLGVSHDHWQAQNWLTQPTLLASDASNSTAVFTSTKAFDSENDRAWWVAYDLIELAGREIHSSNELLKSTADRNCQSFAITRIAGSGNARELSKYVRTQGWLPSPIELKVGDVKGLVEKLGGQSLYGSNDLPAQIIVVLRELIQNARDAINARSQFEPDAPRKILVQLKCEDQAVVLSILDTGCGMTRAVMTGPMLDFGSSFWTSDLVNLELPSLKGSGFRSAGKYGIGFYSTFMISDAVKVTSRNYKQGLEQSNQLIFRDGLSLRPQLIEGEGLNSMEYTTEIRLLIRKLDGKTTFEFPFGTSYLGNDAPRVSFREALSHIAQFSNVNVWLQENDQLDQLAFADILSIQIPTELQVADTIRLGGSPLSPEQLDALRKNMRPIDASNPQIGVAALYPHLQLRDGYGAKTIGGLRTNLSGGDASFIGFIDHTPDSAKRNPHKPTASESQLQSWCNEQLSLLEKCGLSDLEWHFVSCRLAKFGVDPTPYFRVPVFISQDGLAFLTIDALTSLMLTKSVTIVTESYISTIAEERDAAPLAIFPRIGDPLGMINIFERSVKSGGIVSGSEPDYSLKALIETSLASKEKRLTVSSVDSNAKTTRFGSPMKITTLDAV